MTETGLVILILVALAGLGIYLHHQRAQRKALVLAQTKAEVEKVEKPEELDLFRVRNGIRFETLRPIPLLTDEELAKHKVRDLKRRKS